jgi:hypothetical protein
MRVLKLFSTSGDAEVVGPLYNRAVENTFVDFNDDDQACDNTDFPSCTTIDHPSCSITGQVASNISYPPITMTFTAIVEASIWSCCNANSCASVYLDTESADLSEGDTFSYSYR